jgi:enoyl-CoA hydratase
MPLLLEQRGSVAILTLSRPEARNAWCEEFQTGLTQRLPELEADPEVRCVILPVITRVVHSAPAPI